MSPRIGRFKSHGVSLLRNHMNSRVVSTPVFRQLRDFVERMNIEIGVIYDIGAHNGEWTRQVQRTFKNSSCFVFEANPLKSKLLEDFGPRAVICMLGRTDGIELPFYETQGTGDSVYRELTDVYAMVEPKLLISRSLDDVVKERKFPLPDFMKLDTQGSEIDVLEGAKATLSKCSLIMSEVPIWKYNSGAPSFQDYLDYFEGIGFIPVLLLDSHYSKGRLIQFDILFLKQDSLKTGQRLT